MLDLLACETVLIDVKFIVLVQGAPEILFKCTDIDCYVQYVAQFPATEDVNMYFISQKASNQLKVTLKVASVFKKQV